MDVVSQRRFKTSQVQESFERIGGLDPESFPKTKETVGTDEVYNYRTKITPHYDVLPGAMLERGGKRMKKRRNGKSKRTGGDGSENQGVVEIRAIGFKKKTNRQLVDVPNCHIATEAINTKLAQVREEKFRESREGHLKLERSKAEKKKGRGGGGDGVTMLLRDAFEEQPMESTGVGSGVRGEGEHEGNDLKAVVETDPNVYVMADVKELKFRFMAGNFFQNNPFILPVMVDHVVEAAVKPNEHGTRMTHLIDCYCGSGLFCLSSATHFDVCIGIEVNKKAVEEARINASLNGITNCKFMAASAEAIFESQEPVTVKTVTEPLTMTSCDAGPASITLKTATTTIQVDDFPRDTTTVIIDPPRKGCSPEFLEQLYKFGPQRVVYMSCDPATQARDSNGIVGAGYRIVSIQPFDLFPQTRHIECLVTFTKMTIPFMGICLIMNI